MTFGDRSAIGWNMFSVLDFYRSVAYLTLVLPLMVSSVVALLRELYVFSCKPFTAIKDKLEIHVQE